GSSAPSCPSSPLSSLLSSSSSPSSSVSSFPISPEESSGDDSSGTPSESRWQGSSSLITSSPLPPTSQIDEKRQKRVQSLLVNIANSSNDIFRLARRQTYP